MAKCMIKLKEENVEIIRPDKSPFAEKTKAVLEAFSQDPAMKKIVEEIQAQ